VNAKNAKGAARLVRLTPAGRSEHRAFAMRAIVITRPGGPEVLELRDVKTPEPAPGQARVRVRACAVNRADLLQRMGAYPAPPDAPADIPGLEIAGEVDAVGEGVTDVRVGDRVFAVVGGGAYAEAVVVHARTLAPIPANLEFVEAAAIPEAFVTAYDAIVLQGGLAAGESLLVHAAGSGVGTAAVQIARAIGARAIGTARSADKLERAKELGLFAGVVPDGTPARFADAVRAANGGHGVDVVLELVGGAYVPESLASLADRGRLVLVGLMAGTRADVDLAVVLRRRLRVFGTVLRARPLEEKIAAGQVLARHIAPLFASGALRPIVDRVLPLESAAEAHALMGQNETFGKIVLRVS
jgi:NADPH:quinone reductase